MVSYVINRQKETSIKKPHSVNDRLVSQTLVDLDDGENVSSRMVKLYLSFVFLNSTNNEDFHEEFFQ